MKPEIRSFTIISADKNLKAAHAPIIHHKSVIAEIENLMFNSFILRGIAAKIDNRIKGNVSQISIICLL